jgi:V8-like Glu-specific endopeptidase
VGPGRGERGRGGTGCGGIGRGRMRNGVLAAAIAILMVSGCSAGPAAGGGQSGADGSSGAAGYWSRSRLLGAQPFGEEPPADRPFAEGSGGPHSGGRARGGERLAALPDQTPVAHSAITLRVGALFEADSSGQHFCTASVVDSPGEDLLVTAAHCINSGNGNGYKNDIVFIPGYHDGTAPYGIWTPQRLLVAPQWANSADPDFDVGFVILQPYDGENIEQVLGANQLGYDSSYRYLVRVTGYPDSADAPITCVNWTTRQSATQLRFDCGGYTDGTSGSPWVTHFSPRSRTGTIVGVIGGYQQGGDSPAISYSAYFGSGVRQLYQQAITDESEGGQG